ncbi:MAG: hypothetical protein AB1798_14175 [Spirochaetota bacterium]
METIWIDEKQLQKSLIRNETFWKGELEEYPLMWITAPNSKKNPPALKDPADLNEKWTNIDLAMAFAENDLARTHYAGDALPVFNPWLGPDQLGAWLGCALTLRVTEFTSWVKPFVKDWHEHQEFFINHENRWWKHYLNMLTESIKAGKSKWITSYPDLHCGIDGLAAIRGPQNLMTDILEVPELLVKPMKQMTALFKYVFDLTSEIICPGGQGTSNWTMGWSEKRFMCIGHNDVACMISPEMFDKFCLKDTEECIDYVDISIYHMDGPGQIPFLPRLLSIDNLHTIQWIQGAGNPYPSRWLDLLKKIQAAGKSVQVVYVSGHGGEADLRKELDALCANLDPTRLFMYAVVKTEEDADGIVEYARKICKKKRNY